MVARFALPLILLFASSPALAVGGAPIPESSSLSLFVLGVIGVLVGRKLSMRKSDRDD